MLIKIAHGTTFKMIQKLKIAPLITISMVFLTTEYSSVLQMVQAGFLQGRKCI